MFNPEILLRISKEVGAPVSRVETTIKLFEEGGTVPFIARYRKEATGNLDEVKIRDIDERQHYYSELENRRATVLASIEKQVGVVAKPEKALSESQKIVINR